MLLPNATTGLNVVISSVVARLAPGDTIYSLDIGWGHRAPRGGVHG